MDCPRCNTALHPVDLDGVMVDECPACAGIWFDQGEFADARDQADPDLSWRKFDIWTRQDGFKLTPKPVFCPRCSTEMFGLDYASTNIEIDVCSRCHGVWLDGGEFEKIIDQLNSELVKADVSDFVRASLTEGKEIFTGPKGLKSEWKDFTTVLRLLQYRVFIEKPRLLYELIEGQKGAPIW